MPNKTVSELILDLERALSRIQQGTTGQLSAPDNALVEAMKLNVQILRGLVDQLGTKYNNLYAEICKSSSASAIAGLEERVKALEDAQSS